METKPIITDLGIIQYRDTIFLDSVETSIYPLTLKLEGKINGEHCSKEIQNPNILFCLDFFSVEMFNCFELDHSPVDKFTKSSFDEVINSSVLEAMDLAVSRNHFIVSTYDYVFKVVAENFNLDLEV